MLLRNFHNLLGTMIQSMNVNHGMLPITDTYGMQYYTAVQFPQFPYSRSHVVASNQYGAGISFGSGSKPVRDGDFQLDKPFSASDVTTQLTKTEVVDNGGEPYIQFSLTVTNISSETLTLREVCYKQVIAAHRYVGDTAGGNNYTFMLDRTLIEPEIVLGPSEAAVVKYRLMTKRDEPTVVSGVTIVSWEFGTDEQVTAMIQAARSGTIDLSDYWSVGDMRPVEVEGFVSGGATNATQTIDLVITAFGDYNECGSVMQVDFMEALATPIRMNGTNTNVGGYGESEMAKTTLPMLATKLPSWIQSLMRTFTVLTSAGNNSDDIVEVTGNKLALRSQMEIRNGYGNSKNGEGSAIAWYQTDNKMRQKRRGRSGSVDTYWFRSPAKSATQYAYVSRGDAQNESTLNANSATGVAPFMCL